MVRTSVTLDPDVEQIVRDRMAVEGVSFKRALNDAIRDGASGRVDIRFSMDPVDLGEPLVGLTHANRLAGDLEDAEILQEMRAGR